MKCLLDLAYLCTLLPHYLWHRAFTGKYGEKASEKLGLSDLPKSDGVKRLWVHAVSVGEVLAARGIVSAFKEAYPGWEILVSTTTATGREVAEKNFGAENVFYYPLDISSMVGKTFSAVKPDLVVLMELEVWPNFLLIAQERDIPVVVANVRITEKSVGGFKRFGSAAAKMLNRIKVWLAQSEEYAARLRILGVEESRIKIVGSVKYDNIPVEPDIAVRNEYRGLLGVAEGENVVVAGSTHPSEEKALLEAWKTLGGETGPVKRLVLVPRHPERLDEVEALAASYGGVMRRSVLSAEKAASVPFVLVDTMGELGRLYSAADAVFVGGSLISHGGQNMMEPCGLGKPTVIGPSSFNFAEAMEALVAGDGILVIDGEEKLGDAFAGLFADYESALAMGERGRQVLLGLRGATEKTMKELVAYTG